MTVETRPADAVRPVVERLDLEARLERYAPHRWRGGDGSPILHLDDVSGIPFVQDVAGVEEYQHRARVRARSGDLFVAVTAPSDGYEGYCRGRLGLGEPEFVLADGGDHGYAVATACLSAPAFQQLVDAARAAGRLAIHPYMAIEEVWRLAAAVAGEAAVPVEVVGPPPPVLWTANDKALLSEIVSRVLSPDWIVESVPERTPPGMARSLAELAGRHRRVGFKRARCASGLGNEVFDGAAIRGMNPAEVGAVVDGFLARTEWPGDEDVVVVAWEEADCSPSAQLWIPPPEQGPPILEGIYEQVLEGPSRIFVGSRPSTLPEAVNRAVGDAALRVAAALAALGYVGRCSFDTILLGDPDGEFAIKFTECNGRWGGTSTPMHLVDRLVKGSRPPYWAQDFMHGGLVGVPFREVLERVGDALYDPASGRGQYVFYNVGPLADYGKLDVIAIGSDPAEAEALVREELPRRLGLYL